MMDYEYFDSVVFDRKIGIDTSHSPHQLMPNEFIDLLNSRESYDHTLNTPLSGGEYWHTTTYKSVEFLSITQRRIYDITEV